MVLSQPYYYPGPHQWIIWSGQLLLIPGIAALFSRLLYGSARWGIRALTILVVSIAPVTFMIGLAYGIYILSSVTWEAPKVTIALFVLFLLIVGLGIGKGLFFFFRRVSRRTAEIEARRWLAERQAGADRATIGWRNRGIRWALCVPSVIVLLVFSFLPETWGIVSHLMNPRAGAVGAYHVAVPITWVVLQHDKRPEGDETYTIGLAGRGIALELGRYLHNDLPLSLWNIRITESSRSQEYTYRRWAPKDSEILARRAFTIGDERVTCQEYWPSYLARPEHVETAPSVFIECSGTRRLSASLVGERIHASAFYRMVEGIRVQ